jgi:hypothetical protein
MGNPDFRNEIASCIRTDADQHDGLPAAAFGVPDAFGGVLRSAIRNVDFGAVAAKRLRNLTLQSAALVAIMSDDDRVSLLRAGEVLELMLLTLTRLGVHYSFLNQPLEVPALRSQTEHLFRSRKPLQLVLRIGYCDGEVAATARRSLDVAILRS